MTSSLLWAKVSAVLVASLVGYWFLSRDAPDKCVVLCGMALLVVWHEFMELTAKVPTYPHDSR